MDFAYDALPKFIALLYVGIGYSVYEKKNAGWPDKKDIKAIMGAVVALIFWPLMLFKKDVAKTHTT